MIISDRMKVVIRFASTVACRDERAVHDRDTVERRLLRWYDRLPAHEFGTPPADEGVRRLAGLFARGALA
jgi:hypothetical protein